MKTLLTAIIASALATPSNACDVEMAVLAHQLGYIEKQCVNHKLTRDGRKIYEAALVSSALKGESGIACLEKTHDEFVMRMMNVPARAAAERNNQKAFTASICSSIFVNLRLDMNKAGKPHLVDLIDSE